MTSKKLALLGCGMFSMLPLLSQQVNATGEPPSSGIENARLAEVRPLDGKLYHVQGIDLDKEHIWVTSVDTANHKGYLHQFNRATAKLEREVEVSDGPRFHPGGFSLHGNSIWVPVAEYKPHSTAVIEEFDKKTLKLKRKFFVADHLGCLAVAKNVLIGGNWGSRQLYVFNLKGKQLRVLDNPSMNQYQDIKWVDKTLVASGNLSRTSGAIDWYAWPSMKLVRSVHSGVTDHGKPYTGEAMAMKGDDLFLLPEDGPSRLFHFVLSK